MTRRRWWLVAVLAVALVLLAGRGLAALYVDYRWYDSLGAAELWRTKIAYIAVLKLFSGLAAGAFVFGNLYAVRHSVVSLRFPRRLANLEIAEEVPGRYLNIAAIAISVALGALFTLEGEHWRTLALTQLGVPFGEGIGGYFEADLGFFVYWLPLEWALFVWALVVVLMASAVVIFLYALTPSLRWERGALYVSNYVRRHLAVLATALLLIVAWWFHLDAYGSFIDGSGVEGAFTYIDYHARVQANLFLSAGLIGAAVTVLISAWQAHTRLAIGTILIAATLALTVRRIAPVLTQRMTAASVIAASDRSLIAVRAEYSRRAYGADRIARDNGSARFPSLAAAAHGVPVWDAAALTRAPAPQRRGLASAWVGWTPSAGGPLAVIPERPASSGDARSPWNVAFVLATAVDNRGEALHITRAGAPAIEDPLVMPVLVHDSASAFLVVADSQNRIVAPALDGAGARLATAWSMQNFRLYFGDAPRPNPKLILRRALRDRVSALVPFFDQSSAEFPVVVGDTLWWVVDLYSASSTYPMSHHVTVKRGEVSYFQHAATAMVNASSGQVAIVADAELEPIARSWVRAFPGLFTTWSRLPAQLAQGVPPAVDALRAQAEALSRYGLVGEQARGGHVAWNDGSDKPLQQGEPPLLLLGGANPRLAATEVALDSADRVVGALVGFGGADRVARWVPLARPGPSWSALEDQLRRASDSASATTHEAQLVRGRIRVVPVAGSLVYVQPAYFWPNDGAALLARVVTFDGEMLRSGVTLADAAGLAPNAAPDSSASAPATPSAFRARVQGYYEQMRTALRRGDWPAFGRAYDALGALLAQTPPAGAPP